MILTIALHFSLFCIILALFFTSIRLMKGPTVQDRILALDSIWLLSLLLIVLLSIYFSSLLYFEMALVIALTGFISSFALAKFLMRGEIIE